MRVCGFLCTRGFLSIHSASFLPTVLLPGAALPCSIGQGSFGLGSLVYSTMATLRPLIILPARFFLYTRGTIDLLLFVSLFFLSFRSLGAGEQPGSFVFRFVRLRCLIYRNIELSHVPV